MEFQFSSSTTKLEEYFLMLFLVREFTKIWYRNQIKIT